MARARSQEPDGFSLAELLVGLAILGLLAALGWSGGSETLARQRLEAATRRLDQGIQRGRAEAQKLGRPCGLSLQPQGWVAPAQGSLSPCLQTLESLQEPLHAAEVRLVHNFPAVLRFSPTATGFEIEISRYSSSFLPVTSTSPPSGKSSIP